MSFWDNVFDAGPRPVQQAYRNGSPAPQGRAWWQELDPYQDLAPGNNSHVVQQDQRRGLTPQDIQKIRRKGHQQISPEEAELIAEYDLATKEKFQHRCPECDSGNFLQAGQRVAGVIMPTDKCFDCGHSARGPEPAVGGGSGQDSIHTRQIDTGGAGGSMFMRFNGVPRNYAPRT